MRFLTLSTGRSLPDWHHRDDWSVALLSSLDTSRLAPSSFSVSPIHPLIEDQRVPDLEGERWSVHFLALKNPFSTLGRIRAKAYPGLEHQTWFGIGLPSVIIFLKENDAIERLISESDSELLAHEVWIVDKSRLDNIDLRRRPLPAEISTPVGLGSVVQTLPNALSAVAEEFSASIHTARGWSSSYAKDELPALDQLVEEVGSLLSELAWLSSNRTAIPPDGLRDADLQDDIECRRLVQQRSDRLIQINSSLSYVITQAFFGSPPVLAESLPVRRHSLLGVGRAHRALNNLVREVEAAFHTWSIGRSIFEKWGAAPPLRGFGSARELDSSVWSQGNLPDLLLDRSSGTWECPTLTSPKLVYFSGRLGFRESEYSISAAINCLTSGAVGDWHVSTMTHEILHGHVRDLLHMTFDTVKLEESVKHSAFWAGLCRRFRNHMLNGETENLRLVDSVRHLFLSYCCMVGRFGSLTQDSEGSHQWSNPNAIGDMMIPDADSELLRLLAREDRNISEIMVHTLDLFYFYFDAFDEYNVACWSSWRNVPAVLRDVRQYVLRVMLAVTSLDDGEHIGRFARARNRVRNSLLQNDVLRTDPVAKAAISLLDLPEEEGIPDRTREANHALFRPFVAAVRIADVTRHCFASGKVRGELFRDGTISSILDGVDFDIEPWKFSDHNLRSVAAFIARSARRQVANLTDNAEEERRTAWLFLACGGMSEAGSSETGGTHAES